MIEIKNIPSPADHGSPFARCNDRNGARAAHVAAPMNMKAHDVPSNVSAEEGEVLVDGPGGVAIAFTPEAAEETSERLLLAAMSAQAQRRGRKPADR